jgi:hypothetical protein
LFDIVQRKRGRGGENEEGESRRTHDLCSPIVMPEPPQQSKSRSVLGKTKLF